MPRKGRKQQKLLPGADERSDCQTTEDPAKSVTSEPELTLGTESQTPAEDHEHDVSWFDVGGDAGTGDSGIASWIPRRAGWTVLLERIALAVERPANRLIGTAQLNPFYHTGTIATLLLILVALTGFYLFLFLQYGFDASYNAVLTRIEAPFIARTIRAIHRYASGALVITTLLHAYRTLFMERFRGPRWLAWLTGIAMTGLLWFAGVTGYWLIWDQRAQIINDAFVAFLQTATPFAAPYMVAFVEAAASESSWPIFLTIFAVHVLLFLVVAGSYWLHIKRLNRPKWLPPVFWVVGVGVVVVLVSVLFPAGMLPQGDLTRLPGPVTIDPIFLFYLPAAENAWLNWLVWGGLVALTAVAVLLPWVNKRHRSGDSVAEQLPVAQPKVQIIKERCTGCTVCALDCPYGAIQMVERHDGKRHKYIAIEDPSLCVSCGICVGSCDGVAVTLGMTPPAALWDTVASQIALAKLRQPVETMRVVFTCERHADQGARPNLAHSRSPDGRNGVEVIALPCVGTLPPDLLARTLDEGVANVHVIGCPADDCANREGNLWLEQRIVRERVPRLKRPYANTPITASWLPPDDFERGIAAIPSSESGSRAEDTPDYLEMRRILQPFTWRNYISAFFLLALVMITQILLTDLPFSPYPDKSAIGRVVISDVAGPIGRSSYIGRTLGPELILRLEVDGETILEDQLETAVVLGDDSYPYYDQVDLTSGTHQLRLTLGDPATATTFVYFNASVNLDDRDILTIPFPSAHN